MTTAIEWTDETWNPTTGCDRVSPGCDNCYIERTIPFRMEGRRFDENGKMGVRLHPDRLDKPLHWRKPRRVFVNSLSDLFHPQVPEDFIGRVLDVIRQCPQHAFQVLTKRPQRMADVMFRYYDCDHGGAPSLACPYCAPLANLWLLASIESDPFAFRANHVRRTPAAVRGLSLEPLLGPLPSLDLTEIDWVIVGGESGPGARPMHPAWVDEIRDQCVAAGVAFFFKQWGEYGPFPPGWPDEPGCVGSPAARKVNVAVAYDGRFWPVDELAIEYDDDDRYCDPLNRRFHYVHETGRQLAREWKPGGLQLHSMYRVGKKTAGRDLDGRTWDEMPERAAVVL